MSLGAQKKKSNLLSTSALLLLLLLIVCGLCIVITSAVLLPPPLCDQQESAEAMVGGLVGAPKEVKNSENSAEIDEIAKFAVNEHNTKEGKNLTFKKVVSAKTQVVSGTLYHLTLEATHENEPKIYDAKVWTKPWESHKTLEHFKEAESSSSQ